MEKFTSDTANPFDIAIIGGGINGCGIARDAAGRGASVYLCEQNDLASATSSASTKLIHGGLRYLEYYEFRLVRESLVEREVLYRMAPHLIRPMRFVFPHLKGLRPAWLIRLGLFLYDHLGGRELLPGTRGLDLTNDEAGQPLKPGLTKAFEYSDCTVDDSRLVIMNALDAAEHGAVIETRTACASAKREDGVWAVTTENTVSGERSVVFARSLINASGPWVTKFIADGLDTGHLSKERVRLVKGSHIVVPSMFSHDRSYIFQNSDGRIVFAIPYAGGFTLVGTTDEDFQGDLSDVAISKAETSYLCALANDYFKTSLSPADVVHSFSGVRPLFDDGASKAQSATRDYVLKVDGGSELPPVLNIFGGKITTYRKLAEHALEKIVGYLPAMKGPWTSTSILPGGRITPGGEVNAARELRETYSFLSDTQALRLISAYGSRAINILGDVTSEAGLGERFGPDLSAKEVEYLMDVEWAKTADDILWRRSKLGLTISGQDAARLGAWMAAR